MSELRRAETVSATVTAFSTVSHHSQQTHSSLQAMDVIMVNMGVSNRFLNGGTHYTITRCYSISNTGMTGACPSMSPKIFLSPEGIWAPIQYMVPSAQLSSWANSTSIGSAAVFAGLTQVSNRETHRDRPSYISSNRPHPVLCIAMQANNKNKWYNNVSTRLPASSP